MQKSAAFTLISFIALSLMGSNFAHAQSATEEFKLVPGNYKILGRGIENSVTHESLAFVCLNISDANQLLPEKEYQYLPEDRRAEFRKHYLQYTQQVLNQNGLECNAIRVARFYPQTGKAEFITIPVLLNRDIQAEQYSEMIKKYISFISGNQFVYSQHLSKEAKATGIYLNQNGWGWSSLPVQVKPEVFGNQLFWISTFNHCSISPCLAKFQQINLQPTP